MKRMHVHVSVRDLDTSVQFYSQLFDAEPAVKTDYAKWMLDDPLVNFAISVRGAPAGVEHLGIQVADKSELEEVYGRLRRADRPVLGEGETGPAQWLAEVVATFGLVETIVSVSRSRPGSVAYAVGLYIAAAYWFTSSTSFANPSVTLARSLSDTFAGIQPTSVPAFVLAEFVGALIALAFFGWLLGRKGRPAQ
jgi:catechol 2,3-dioxygenase-like lactoylglutathione lyase family enzyme